MPISAPPPSWASIKNKPTTVAGFGITDMGSQSVASATNATNASNVPWSGVSGRPTTVSGLGLSDFNASAIAANSGMSYGAVGTYGQFLNNATVTIGSTIAGSNLSVYNASNALVSAGVSGTWRNLGAGTLADGINSFVRVA